MTGDKNTKKGFTLVELLVSVFIFSIVIGGVVNALLFSVRIQQRISAEQKMLAETSFVLEYMGRTLRMARKDRGEGCIERNHNYELRDGNRTIRFLNFDGNCQEFSWTENSISEKISSTASSGDLITIPFMPITSGNVTVTRLAFNDAGSAWSSPAPNQSKVAIGLEVNPAGGTGDSRMFFQTVVSQRKLNVLY